MNQHHPAGLLDSSVEFFASPQMKAFCLTSSRVIPFDEFPQEFIEATQIELLKSQAKLTGLQVMGATTLLQQVEQYLVCNYGGLDHHPDLVDGRLQKKEYWPCPKRGSCRFEGIVCDSLLTDLGLYLTKQEILYIKMTAKGLLDKEIADIMGVALSTVATHNENARTKTGLRRKSDLTRYALQKQLI
jgi:DNA-binding CsgD family transcriptional regulator